MKLLYIVVVLGAGGVVRAVRGDRAGVDVGEPGGHLDRPLPEEDEDSHQLLHR